MYAKSIIIGQLLNASIPIRDRLSVFFQISTRDIVYSKFQMLILGVDIKFATTLATRLISFLSH